MILIHIFNDILDNKRFANFSNKNDNLLLHMIDFSFFYQTNSNDYYTYMKTFIISFVLLRNCFEKKKFMVTENVSEH